MKLKIFTRFYIAKLDIILNSLIKMNDVSVSKVKLRILLV